MLPAAQAPSAKLRGQGTARAQKVRGAGAEDAVGGQAVGGICIFSQVLYSEFIRQIHTRALTFENSIGVHGSGSVLAGSVPDGWGTVRYEES